MAARGRAKLEAEPEATSPHHRMVVDVYDNYSYDPKAGAIVAADDPILGKFLCQVGAKKLYSMDVPTLASIPVWEKQRYVRPRRHHTCCILPWLARQC